MSGFFAKLFHAESRKRLTWPAPDEIVEAPLDSCISSFGMLFAPPGWHPFTQEILQRLERPGTALEDSVLFRYYAHTQPKNDDFFPCFTISGYRYRPGLLLTPWGTGKRVTAENKRVHQFGPKPADFVADKRDYLMRLFRNLQRDGYLPERTRDGDIRAIVLIARDGSRRTLINGGQHRTAVLAALGAKTLRLRYQPGWPREICENQAASWPAVVKGEASVEEAVAYFRSYFDLPPDFRKPSNLPTRFPLR